MSQNHKKEEESEEFSLLGFFLGLSIIALVGYGFHLIFTLPSRF